MKIHGLDLNSRIQIEPPVSHLMQGVKIQESRNEFKDSSLSQGFTLNAMIPIEFRNSNRFQDFNMSSRIQIEFSDDSNQMEVRFEPHHPVAEFDKQSVLKNKSSQNRRMRPPYVFTVYTSISYIRVCFL